MYAQVEDQPGSGQAFPQDSQGLESGLGRPPAGRRHNLGHKPRKTKRQLRSGGSSLVHKSDTGRVDQLMPNHR
ncbi:MAG: Ribosomal protein [Steroidobacteraceae bacterium]|nr:Ribosomal protein [Steroidobacteraceae bacterium]